MASELMTSLSKDLLADILARVDGPTLASTACVCSELRQAAKEKYLWQALCHTTWPTTRDPKAQAIISSIPGGFAKFYADSLPLILYNPETPVSYQIQNYNICPSKLVSLVDVFYENRCIFSRVMYGVPMGESKSWFLDCPFKLEALSSNDVGRLPSIIFKEVRIKELCNKLEENVRLSWVVLDLNNGRARNLSSWRTTMVKRIWPEEGELAMRFACAVSNEECVITARCRISEREKEVEVRWVEVGMEVEDIEGVHVDGKGSLVVLERVLGCSERSRDCRVVEKRYREFEKERRVVMERKRRREGMADGAWALAGTVVFVYYFFYVYSLL